MNYPLKNDDRAIFGVIALSILMLGGCFADWKYATPAVHVVEITDKTHIPGHFERRCESENEGTSEHPRYVTSCRDIWFAPVWKVAYSDATRTYITDVPHLTFEKLSLGQKISASFYEGAYTGMRYATQFTSGELESGW